MSMSRRLAICLIWGRLGGRRGIRLDGRGLILGKLEMKLWSEAVYLMVFC